MNWKKGVLSIILATIWISFSEFVRNELLFKSHWVDHYNSMGLVFPSDPVNGAVWGLWSLLLAVLVYIISRKFTLLQTAGIAWFAGFVFMWVVIGNLAVLPGGLLYFAVPWSLVEVLVAVWIVKKVG